MMEIMKTISNQIRKGLPVLALASAVTLAGTALAVTHLSADKTKSGPVAANVPVDETAVPRDSLPRGSFAPIVKKVAPAVVKIETTITVNNTSFQQAPGSADPFWRHFFGDQFGPMMPSRPGGSGREHGVGSGVIVTQDGYVLTNNHVVDNAKEVKVTLPDGRQFTAKVIGRDPKSDLAVIRIEAKNLPVVPLADSDKVQVGDVVLAIGNPFGVGQTVTEGIVSAKHRGNMGIEDYEDFLQTDAAINPGNSGGALVDIEGRLVGINTAILSRSGGSQGVGFAIPSDLARNVMDSLIQFGRVTRGYLGVMIQDVTPDLAAQFKLGESAGALVSEVVPGGPADKAGLKDGDVVLAFNGKSVEDGRHLRLAVGEIKPGSTVPMKIWRDGAARNLDVTVKELPGPESLAQKGTDVNSDSGTLNGVIVSDLDPQTRQEFKLPEHVKGALVTEVKPNSAAADAGIKPGDVIQEINHRPVKSADEAVRLTENGKDKRTLLRVWEQGGSHYVVVDESHNAG
jgi:serine protease Do